MSMSLAVRAIELIMRICPGLRLPTPDFVVCHVMVLPYGCSMCVDAHPVVAAHGCTYI